MIEFRDTAADLSPALSRKVSVVRFGLRVIAGEGGAAESRRKASVVDYAAGRGTSEVLGAISFPDRHRLGRIVWEIRRWDADSFQGTGVLAHWQEVTQLSAPYPYICTSLAPPSAYDLSAPIVFEEGYRYLSRVMLQTRSAAVAAYAEFNFGGEVLVTIGRTIHFFEQGARLVVNCAPFGCMPGQTITGILNEVQQDHGRPVLSLFYEGTGDLNARIGVFLQNLHD